MRILFTKLTDQSHRMSIVRDDGASKSCELETRSLLLHDLVHHAVETEVPIEDEFWELLARGITLDELADRERPRPIPRGIVAAESLVAPMQSVWQGRLSIERYLKIIAKLEGGLSRRVVRGARPGEAAAPLEHVARDVLPSDAEARLAPARRAAGRRGTLS